MMLNLWEQDAELRGFEHAFERAFERGYERGYARGFERGYKRGYHEVQTEIAQKMILHHFTDDQIAQITDLSLEEIALLRRTNSDRADHTEERIETV